jgi:hypothetical protein
LPHTRHGADACAYHPAGKAFAVKRFRDGLQVKLDRLRLGVAVYEQFGQAIRFFSRRPTRLIAPLASISVCKSVSWNSSKQ